MEIAGAAAAMEAEIRIVGIAGEALSLGSGTTAGDVGVELLAKGEIRGGQ